LPITTPPASASTDIAGRAVIYSAIGRLMHGLSMPVLLLAVALALVVMWLAGRRRQW